ncbi:MAG: Rne/Rng family ribonuclease [Bdellovibrionota bacterium]
MTRRMLINALYPEECRIAVADDDRLIELEVERADHSQQKGNIYKAAITRIEPSLQAAFLDIGSNRNGFLQINDIHPAYFNNWPPENAQGHVPRPSIQDVLRPGQELVVQVVKDQRAAKGATLTTNLSIPGRFLVLMIGNQRGGVSRKIVDEGQRYRLRQAVQKLRLPAGMGIIVRTAGINRSSIELERDLEGLLDIWFELLRKSFEHGSPRLLYQESDLAVRTIRDYLTNNIEEILIDEKSTYERAVSFINKVMPSFTSRVIYFDKPQPLFSSYHLDAQIDETSKPEVILPSGGSIVINTTEAVVAIDVNSGRSTSQSDVEETAFNTNREAAEVIAQQLRLRDLGGLIVIDFIDMNDKRHKQIVEKSLRDAVRADKAKIEIGRISKFGLLELSRQRLKASLTSQSHSVCPHCDGRGRVKTPESAALEALRKIQSAVFAGGVDEIRIRMAPAAALLLLNSKRQVLSQFERECGTTILIYADGRMKPEEYELELRTSGGAHAAHVDPELQFNRSRGPAPAGERRASNERDPESGESSRGESRQGRGGDDRGGRRNRDRRGNRRSSRRGGRRRSGRRDGNFPSRPEGDEQAEGGSMEGESQDRSFSAADSGESQGGRHRDRDEGPSQDLSSGSDSAPIGRVPDNS